MQEFFANDASVCLACWLPEAGSSILLAAVLQSTVVEQVHPCIHTEGGWLGRPLHVQTALTSALVPPASWSVSQARVPPPGHIVGHSCGRQGPAALSLIEPDRAVHGACVVGIQHCSILLHAGRRLPSQRGSLSNAAARSCIFS